VVFNVSVSGGEETLKKSIRKTKGRVEILFLSLERVSIYEIG